MYSPSNEWNRSAVASGLHAGAVEQARGCTPFHLHVGHAPTGDALEVAGEVGGLASRPARRRRARSGWSTRPPTLSD